MGEPEKSLPEIYHEWVTRTIDASGIEISHGLLLTDEGLTVVALVLPVPEAYRFMLAQWVTQCAKAMIFAFDRFAQSNQGTSLGDLMAGHYFTGIERRLFVIEYQHDPRIVRPIDWSNTWWNTALSRELIQVARTGASG